MSAIDEAKKLLGKVDELAVEALRECVRFYTRRFYTRHWYVDEATGNPSDPKPDSPVLLATDAPRLLRALVAECERLTAERDEARTDLLDRAAVIKAAKESAWRFGSPKKRTGR